jgi:hypothetical protein
MQAIGTIDLDTAARVVGLVAATLIAVVLVAALVVANLGIGFEGMADTEQRLKPPASMLR